MKPFFRKALGLALVAACTAVWIVTTGMSARNLRARTCQGKGSLDVTTPNNIPCRFRRFPQTLSAEIRVIRAIRGNP